MLHHCDLGGHIAAMAFPALENCEALVERHVQEDLGWRATFQDWVAAMETQSLPGAVARRVERGPDGVAELVANRLALGHLQEGCAYQDFTVAAETVAAFLWLPLKFAHQAPFSILAVLMNSVGPSIVRRVFGPPIRCFDGNRPVIIDYGYIAEAIIMASFGRIPDLAEVARCVLREPVRIRADQ
jgi:hypothetical protein